MVDYLARPIGEFKGTDRMTINDRNIAALARFFRGMPVEPPPGTGLATAKPARASSVWGPGYEADQAFDGDDSTRWGAAPGSRSGWLEVDLGWEQTVTSAYIDEAGYGRTRRFEIQFPQGDSWTPIATGTVLGDKRAISFETPVKARVFRLHILEASEVPTISEFQLFGSEPSPP